MVCWKDCRRSLCFEEVPNQMACMSVTYSVTDLQYAKPIRGATLEKVYDCTIPSIRFPITRGTSSDEILHYLMSFSMLIFHHHMCR